jgi:hypothetical protein
MRASGQFGLTPLTDNRKPSADLEPQPHSRSRKPSAPPRDGPLTPNIREISAPSPLTRGSDWGRQGDAQGDMVQRRDSVSTRSRSLDPVRQVRVLIGGLAPCE